MLGTLAPSSVHKTVRSAAACAVLTLALATAARAQVWNEVVDAGELPFSAQVTTGVGPLSTINGHLLSDYDVDLYCVRLTASPPGGSPFISLNCVVNQGPNVYVFDSAGLGLSTNYSCLGGNKIVLAPNGTLAPGTYYVAVSHYGWEAQSSTGLIWLAGIPGQRSPDGPGAAAAIIGWGGIPVPNPINPYTITLNPSYFGFCDSATPAATRTWGALKQHYGY